MAIDPKIINSGFMLFKQDKRQIRGVFAIMRHAMAVFAILSSILFLNHLSIFFPEINFYKTRMEKQLAITADVTAVTLGDSTANSIDFSELCEGGRHFYLGSNDLFGSEAMLSFLISRYPSIKAVYLPIHPIKLIEDNGAQGSRYGFHRRCLYGVLAEHGRRDLIEGDWQNAMIAWYFPIVRVDHWEYPLKKAVADLFGLASPVSPMERFAALAQKKVEKSNKERDRIKRLEMIHLGVNRKNTATNDYYDQSIQYRCADALFRIQAQLKKRDIELILFSPPLTDLFVEYTKTDDPSFQPIRQFYADTMNVLKDRGAVVLNYERDERFFRQYELFKDTKHLNSKGRKLFTKVLKSDLTKIGKSFLVTKGNTAIVELSTTGE